MSLRNKKRFDVDFELNCFQAARAVELQMPVVLPPVNVSGGDFVPTQNDLCLFYLEAINVVVMRNYAGEPKVFRNVIVDGANGTNTFNWDPSYVNCAVSNMTVGVAKYVSFLDFTFFFI